MKIINSLSVFLAGVMLFFVPAKANNMQPMTPPPEDNSPVVLQMQAKKPGDYNFQATVTTKPTSRQPYSGGKLGMIVPALLNGLKYVDLETGQEVPPPWSQSNPSTRLPPVPLPEPLPPPPEPQDHGRIMSVGRDPYNPGGYLITYQDGTVERVSPPPAKKGP